ncbi:MAG: M20/M25/M40 family metallo-hydrolase [Burkholderiaceae bacterium]
MTDARSCAPCRPWLACVGVCLGLLGAPTGAARAADDEPERARLRQIYQELVEIDTTHATGDTTRAARAMARHLVDAGFAAADVQVLEPFPRKGNLVLRYRGTGEKKPLLLVSHLDVVEAPRDDWTGDPFQLQERDGYFVARGSADDKARGAVLVSVLSQLRREGFVPRRDLILALTADEERGDEPPSNGVLWLLKHQRPLIDAEFGLNEGADGELRQGRPVVLRVQLAEKTYVAYELRTRHPGGHASLPARDNAIAELADAVSRIARHEFAMKLSEVTRRSFERLAGLATPTVAADMRELARAAPDPAAVARLSMQTGYNAQLRTTCVPTTIEGGHAEGALPQAARATINCRVLPVDDVNDVERTLASLAGEKVTLKRLSPLTPSPASPMRPDLMEAIERIAGRMWPGVTVVPAMSTGASDSLYLRNAGIPMYGVSGLFHAQGDYRAHGRDERVQVKWLYQSREFIYQLLKALAG